MLPRLLLISEVPLSQEGTGINRTLVNLLKGYPQEQLMLYTSSNPDLTAPTFCQHVATFAEGVLPPLKNRLGTIINGVIVQLNLQWIDWLPIPNRNQIEAFAPEVIVICPNSVFALLMGYKIAQTFNSPYLIYFMDDWVAVNHYRWLSGNVQKLTSDLLHHANGWLMISDRLKMDLAKRYGVTSLRSLVVHNPVDLSNQSPPDFKTRHGTFKVAYAGAIWGMHYDAVAIIAEAIQELRQSGHNIELILYTNESFWAQYQEHWNTWEVTHGGFIPYQQLSNYLRQADLLLVASSFLPDHAHVTRSSVQTKLTDYMASGTPILACGPNYSACNDFLKSWNCGFICETNQIEIVKKELLNCMYAETLRQTLAEKAFQVLKDQFALEQVSDRLYQFIQETHNTTQSK